LDGEAEAHLIALACSAPPEGQKRWTLRLLKRALQERMHGQTVSQDSHLTDHDDFWIFRMAKHFE
jgi:hypothetical protein